MPEQENRDRRRAGKNHGKVEGDVEKWQPIRAGFMPARIRSPALLSSIVREVGDLVFAGKRCFGQPIRIGEEETQPPEEVLRLDVSVARCRDLGEPQAGWLRRGPSRSDGQGSHEGPGAVEGVEVSPNFCEGRFERVHEGGSETCRRGASR